MTDSEARLIADAVKQAMRQHREETGDVGSIAKVVKAQHVAETEADRLATRAKWLTTWIKLGSVAAGVVVAGVSWYATHVEQTVRSKLADEQKVKDGKARVTHVDGEIERLDTSVTDLTTSVDEFIQEQRTENAANRERTVRTETLVEKMIGKKRAEKMAPKTDSYRTAQKAVGVDPGDPIK